MTDEHAINQLMAAYEKVISAVGDHGLVLHVRFDGRNFVLNVYHDYDKVLKLANMSTESSLLDWTIDLEYLSYDLMASDETTMEAICRRGMPWPLHDFYKKKRSITPSITKKNYSIS